MKFGKYLEARQVELPEHSDYFIDYKSLKKLIKQLAYPVSLSLAAPSQTAGVNKNDIDHQNYLDESNEDADMVYRRLQENQSSFFFKVERELEKINKYYLEMELDSHIRFEILQDKFNTSRSKGKLTTKNSTTYRSLLAAIKKFQRDLNSLEQFVELNRTGFLKALKKWDKRSHSQQKEFYFATVISVQPVFTKNDITKLNDNTLNLSVELDEANRVSDTATATSMNDDKVSSREDSNIKNNEEDKFLNPIRYNMNINSNHISSIRFDNDIIVSDKQPLLSTLPSDQVAGINLEIELEIWYKEILVASKLKDTTRRQSKLVNYFDNKIKPKVLDDLIPNEKQAQKVSLDYLSNLFLHLVESEIEDESLKIIYDSIKNYIDFSHHDENDKVFSRRNVFHEAARCISGSRIFVLLEGLQALSSDPERLFKLINAKDFHDRTPLHYASELGKKEFVQTLLETNRLTTIDALDNASETALILAIKNNHIDVAKSLLVIGHAKPTTTNDKDSKLQICPLSVACYHNNYEAAELLLEIGKIDLNLAKDLRGLKMMHVVAERGGSRKLVELLVQHGSDPNDVDDFNKWTPIIYAVQKGHKETVKALLDNGASIEVTDSVNRSPLFYALWEGHVDVLNVLLEKNPFPSVKQHSNTLIIPVTLSDEDMDDIDSFSGIPDLTLPPPIMPPKKYGHTFLERQYLIKISFQSGQNFIKFHDGDDIVLQKPGRMTITTNIPDAFLRNIILPIEDVDDSEVSYQVDTLENFFIDFEFYPSFGTKLIAKTTGILSIMDTRLINGFGTMKLPLFDSRLDSVGELTFDYQIIQSCNVKPLEIFKYETYWKSTLSENNDSNKFNDTVTSSSLSGEFVSISVCMLNDGTLIAAPSFVCDVNNVKIFVNDLTKIQLEGINNYKLDDIPTMKSADDLKSVSNKRYMSLKALLSELPVDIQLDLQICFPTEQEIKTVPIKLSPYFGLNFFIDSIITIVFEHMRQLRHSGQSLRTLVFSCCNQIACSIFNWKQPNFPMLYRFNSLHRNGTQLITDTAHNLKKFSVTPCNIDLKNSKHFCIREMIRLSSQNNLLGVIIPHELVEICQPLASCFKVKGLLLIGQYDNVAPATPLNPEFNGVLIDRVLKFHSTELV